MDATSTPATSGCTRFSFSPSINPTVDHRHPLLRFTGTGQSQSQVTARCSLTAHKMLVMCGAWPFITMANIRASNAALHRRPAVRHEQWSGVADALVEDEDLSPSMAKHEADRQHLRHKGRLATADVPCCLTSVTWFFTEDVRVWQCRDMAAHRQPGKPACRIQMAMRAQLTADIQRRRFSACFWASCIDTSTCAQHVEGSVPALRRRTAYTQVHQVTSRRSSHNRRAVTIVRATPCTGSCFSALSFPQPGRNASRAC